MNTYYVRHQHTAETCPARDPEMGQMLLAHLSPRNALQNGIDIQGEAVLDGQHTLVLIVSADSAEKVDAFMQPFKMAGSVEVLPASSCEAVVERAGC